MVLFLRKGYGFTWIAGRICSGKVATKGKQGANIEVARVIVSIFNPYLKSLAAPMGSGCAHRNSGPSP